jgi:hypothetical protein
VYNVGIRGLAAFGRATCSRFGKHKPPQLNLLGGLCYFFLLFRRVITSMAVLIAYNKRPSKSITLIGSTPFRECEASRRNRQAPLCRHHAPSGAFFKNTLRFARRPVYNTGIRGPTAVCVADRSELFGDETAVIHGGFAIYPCCTG